MNTLQARSDDFICSRENVLWLLGFEAFYKHCPAFAQLWPYVQELHKYMVRHGLTQGGGPSAACKRCDAFKAAAGQKVALDGFAKIFIWLFDAGRIQELNAVRRFASAGKKREFGRIVLAYSGKATKGKERLIVVP